MALAAETDAVGNGHTENRLKFFNKSGSILSRTAISSKQSVDTCCSFCCIFARNPCNVSG